MTADLAGIVSRSFAVVVFVFMAHAVLDDHEDDNPRDSLRSTTCERTC